MTTTVQLAVEDSGKGIPVEKRARLFEKFQESLDSLNQGTGIGLNLCKSLVQLMGGEIWLDADYNSGIPGCPGARFVVDLKVPPVVTDTMDLPQHSSTAELNENDNNTAHVNLSSPPTAGRADQRCSPAGTSMTSPG